MKGIFWAGGIVRRIFEMRGIFWESRWDFLEKIKVQREFMADFIIGEDFYTISFIDNFTFLGEFQLIILQITKQLQMKILKLCSNIFKE